MVKYGDQAARNSTLMVTSILTLLRVLPAIVVELAAAAAPCLDPVLVGATAATDRRRLHR